MAQTQQRIARQITKTVSLDYLLHTPAGYGHDAGRQWPLVLFLHGAGERGSDLGAVARHGIPRMASQHPEALPFIAVSPLCPADTMWDELTDELLALLDDIGSRMSVDRDRVYLTGLSLGGFGAWHLACLQPYRFAALVPVCGGGIAMRGYPARVAVLRDLPVWAFHGALDPVVPVDESRRMVEALRAAGGDPRLTIYPDAAHDCWTRAYQDAELYRWLLDQVRPHRG